MIRVGDPARLGQILGTLRLTEGHTRRGLARDIAALSGRTENTVNCQLWEWDNGHTRPDPSSLGHYLAALGYELALIPREEPDEVVADLEPAPSAATIASVLAIADAPYREDAALIPLEDA